MHTLSHTLENTSFEEKKKNLASFVFLFVHYQQVKQTIHWSWDNFTYLT